MSKLLRCPECGHETIKMTFTTEGSLELRDYGAADGLTQIAWVNYDVVEEEVCQIPDELIHNYYCNECGHQSDELSPFVDDDTDDRGEYDYERAADAVLERQEMEDFAQDGELHNMSAEDVL